VCRAMLIKREIGGGWKQSQTSKECQSRQNLWHTRADIISHMR
jgi:hypothetical protein